MSHLFHRSVRGKGLGRFPRRLLPVSLGPLKKVLRGGSFDAHRSSSLSEIGVRPGLR